jgi:hypothetical protein
MRNTIAKLKKIMVREPATPISKFPASSSIAAPI